MLLLNVALPMSICQAVDSATTQITGFKFSTRLCQPLKLTTVSEFMVVPRIYDLQLYGNPSKVIAPICEYVIS